MTTFNNNIFLNNLVNNNNNSIFHNCDRIMILKLFINSDDNILTSMYQNSAATHNANMVNRVFPDAGFDLFTPVDTQCTGAAVTKINFLVRTSAQIVCENGKVFNTGFQMCPRSSLSGTPLRLANSIGIIDSGYRGDLIGKFDCLLGGDNDYIVSKYDKLLQIVAPAMVPIYVMIVESESELGVETDRGAGGFGSTGR
uniref:dUTPase-like domain-containing protein n=1 Tax=viral metagenome TaxID=1070528 RepID=A0A6C0K2A9_9ZZZZ